MTEILSRRCQMRRIGVWPRGAHVLRTLGISRNPDSSTKTRWAPSRAAFFGSSDKSVGDDARLTPERVAGPASTEGSLAALARGRQPPLIAVRDPGGGRPGPRYGAVRIPFPPLR